jgi:hypothetical protein
MEHTGTGLGVHANTPHIILIVGAATSAPQVRRRDQPRNHLTLHQMFVDNFVDIGRIKVAVPHAFGIYHGHGATGTPVHAPRLVHPDLARTRQPRRTDPGFAVVKRRLRLMLGTAFFAVFALVETKKDVSFEILNRISHGQNSKK